MLTVGPCDETLPPYSEPDAFLSGKIYGYYNLSPTMNGITVLFTVTNKYEETLDEVVDIHGSIEITSVRDPSVAKTISISAGRLIYAKSYNPVTKQLTLDSKDSLVFAATWDFTLDDHGVDVRQNFFTYYQDPACSQRCRAGTEEFSITGGIIIFNGRADVRAHALFPLCYVSNYVDPKNCVSVTTFPPCLQPPSAGNGLCSPVFAPDE